MRLLLVEDEASVAHRIERLTRKVLGPKLQQFSLKHTLAAGLHHLQTYPIDVLLLDLNLNGEDGFRLLEDLVSRSFHTIVISANLDRAVTAFEYGVLDFVPKPFTEDRLQKAFARYEVQRNTGAAAAKFLSVRKNNGIHLLESQRVQYAKAAGNYTELYLEDGDMHLHDKNMQSLLHILPTNFCRIHRSYIVNRYFVDRLVKHGGGKYEVRLTSGAVLPVSRTRYQDLVDN